MTLGYLAAVPWQAKVPHPTLKVPPAAAHTTPTLAWCVRLPDPRSHPISTHSLRSLHVPPLLAHHRTSHDPSSWPSPPATPLSLFLLSSCRRCQQPTPPPLPCAPSCLPAIFPCFSVVRFNARRSDGSRRLRRSYSRFTHAPSALRLLPQPPPPRSVTVRDPRLSFGLEPLPIGARPPHEL